MGLQRGKDVEARLRHRTVRVCLVMVLITDTLVEWRQSKLEARGKTHRNRAVTLEGV
jgi:hypothetical protein